jgi:hypothetical protein
VAESCTIPGIQGGTIELARGRSKVRFGSRSARMRRHILTLSLLGAFLCIDEVEEFLPLSMGSASCAMKAVPMAHSLDSLEIEGDLSKPTQSGTWAMLGVPAVVH